MTPSLSHDSRVSEQHRRHQVVQVSAPDVPTGRQDERKGDSLFPLPAHARQGNRFISCQHMSYVKISYKIICSNDTAEFVVFIIVLKDNNVMYSASASPHMICLCRQLGSAFIAHANSLRLIPICKFDFVHKNIVRIIWSHSFVCLIISVLC